MRARRPAGRLPLGGGRRRNGTGALHSYLSHLRKRLEPDRDARSREGLIARHGPGYVLRVDADAVDAWQFERLLQARRRSLTDPGDAGRGS